MQKKHLLVAAVGLILPLLHSCSEYRIAGYSKARVHVKAAPASLARQTVPTPAPQAQPRQIAPQAVPPQDAIPASLLAPLPTAAPSPAATSAPTPTPAVVPSPVRTSATQPSPQHNYPTMPGQNRRLKIR